MDPDVSHLQFFPLKPFGGKKKEDDVVVHRYLLEAFDFSQWAAVDIWKDMQESGLNLGV